MANVKPSQYIIGIVLFCFIIVGGISMLSIFADTDPTFTDDDDFNKFNESFNVLSDVSSQVDSLESSITEADTDFGVFGVLNSLISSSWQSLKLLFTSLSFMDDVFLGMSTMFGVPTWIPTIIVLALTVMIAFAIYSAIFQREL
jgi:hypothetical protein